MVAMVEMVFNGNGEDGGGGLSQWWSKEMAQLVVSVFHVYGAPSSVLPACLSYKLHCTAVNSATAALFSLFDVLHFISTTLVLLAAIQVYTAESVTGKTHCTPLVSLKWILHHALHCTVYLYFILIG